MRMSTSLFNNDTNVSPEVEHATMYVMIICLFKIRKSDDSNTIAVVATKEVPVIILNASMVLKTPKMSTAADANIAFS